MGSRIASAGLFSEMDCVWHNLTAGFVELRAAGTPAAAKRTANQTVLPAWIAAVSVAQKLFTAALESTTNIGCVAASRFPPRESPTRFLTFLIPQGDGTGRGPDGVEAPRHPQRHEQGELVFFWFARVVVSVRLGHHLSGEDAKLTHSLLSPHPHRSVCSNLQPSGQPNTTFSRPRRCSSRR